MEYSEYEDESYALAHGVLVVLTPREQLLEEIEKWATTNLSVTAKWVMMVNMYGLTESELALAFRVMTICR